MTRLIKILGPIKDAWLMVGIAILLLVLLEATLSRAFRAHLLESPSAVPVRSQVEDYRVRADAYAEASWVNDYYREFNRSHVMKWVSYLYWRRQPFRGNYINIDSRGIRRSWAPEAKPQRDSDPLEVFMFGGSTVWGAGVRDDFTVPSILAKELTKEGIECKLTNFGEAGYVSTQEVIALILELQRGNVPDIAIFYDGFSDVYAAYQQRVAGLPHNEFNRVKEFNLSTPKKLKQLRRMVVQDTVNRLSMVRFVKRLLYRFGIQEEPGFFAQEGTLAAHSLSNSEALAHAVLATYEKNIELVRALAEQYHFSYLFYWQPTIFQKAHLTEYERSERQKLKAMDPFFLETYEVVRQGSVAQTGEHPFQDISLILSEVRAPLFVDWGHLGESGNELIARRMATDVLSVASARMQAGRASLRKGREAGSRSLSFPMAGPR